MTIVERILAAHSGGGVVAPGQIVTCDVDRVVELDLQFAGGGMTVLHVHDPSKIAIVLDHAAPQSLDEVARIPQEVDGPVMYNWVTGGHSPVVTLEQLQEWGYAMAIIPGVLIGTVVRAMIQALERAGAPTPMSDDLRSPVALFDTVGLSDWLATAARFAHE